MKASAKLVTPKASDLPDSIQVEAERKGTLRCRVGAEVFYLAPNVKSAAVLCAGRGPDGSRRVVFGPAERAVLVQAARAMEGEPMERWFEDACRIKRALGGSLDSLRVLPRDDGLALSV